jgi:hypothetical protein
MSEIKRYLLTTPEQCLQLKTFIKNLPLNETLYMVKPCPNGYEVLVQTNIELTAVNHNIIRRLQDGNMHIGYST